MRCPIDDTELKMTDRQGVEIDYCPQCRGVWLDRGELDKIIERAAAMLPPTGRTEDYRDRDGDDRREGYEGSRGYSDYGTRQPEYRRKRRSFLDDIFDFD
jgi:hypothetical protein